MQAVLRSIELAHRPLPQVRLINTLQSMNSALALHDFYISSVDSVDYLARGGTRTVGGPIWLIAVAVIGGVAWRFRDKIRNLFNK